MVSMINRYGIYGYECTKETAFDTIRIIPKSNDLIELKKPTSDSEAYKLTSFLKIKGDNATSIRSTIFDLEAIFSFIEQKDVIITNRLRDNETFENLDADYPTALRGHHRAHGGSSVIMKDTFSINSRKTFIEMALNKLTDKADSNNESFRTAFFKTIEVCRNNRSFLDVDYYLLFSALEALSRTILNDFESKNCSAPISKVLKNYGFDISQDNPDALIQAVSTYAHLRNALFHNGKLEKEVNMNGDAETLDLATYYSPLQRLMPLVMMKYIGFDDGHVNWNSWLDRMMFK